MRLFLQDGPARLQILSRSHVRELRDLGSAREFLRPLLANPGNIAAARRELGGSEVHIWTNEELLDQLANRIVREGLQIVSCADSYLAALQGTFQDSTAAASAASASQAAAQQQQAQTTPLQDEEAAQAEQANAPAAEEKHWIEIELKDDEGNPIAGESYFVELPDGTSISGRTDSNGHARIEGIDPGTAKVSFPDRDESLHEG
jgi:hypothetical protein